MSQIHQEVVFKAPPARVYWALISERQFAEWSGDPAEIDGDQGGAFMCFGTFILGRNIELIPDARIVQAWRAFNWESGVYSIVHIELLENGAGTRLVLDQDGVPDDAVEHVEPGWQLKYWDPIRAYVED